MTENESQKHGIMDGLKESITVKLLFIATLILLLLIPIYLAGKIHEYTHYNE